MDYLISNKKHITLPEITSGEYEYNENRDTLGFTLSFIKKWQNNENSYDFHTSGSTGTPKPVRLSRSKLVYSAEQTLSFLGLRKIEGKSLLIIPPEKIGGAMVIVRSLISNLNPEVMEPGRDFSEINEEYELVSLVPFQVEKLIHEYPDKISKFRNILIGGGPLNKSTEEKLLKYTDSTNIYHTYGMTETASHVALRKIGFGNYRPIGDTLFKTNDQNELMIKGILTDRTWLETHDIVEIENEGFKWLGRSDFIINSGGIKINPEMVEEQIHQMIPSEKFIVSSIPDDELGEKLILIVEGEPKKIELDPEKLSSKYFKPGKIIFIDEIVKTNGGKIDRFATRQKITL